MLKPPPLQTRALTLRQRHEVVQSRGERILRTHLIVSLIPRMSEPHEPASDTNRPASDKNPTDPDKHR